MNYSKVYQNLIPKAQNRDLPDIYTEKHHIVPLSLKGDDSEENKKKISDRRKGVGTHFTPHSEETKKMMSENRKGKPKIPWT